METMDWSLFIKIVIKLIAIILAVYLIGRIFAKGFLHETDNHINRKFKQLKTKKQKEDGTEKEK